MDGLAYPDIVDGFSICREMAAFLTESVAWLRAVARNFNKVDPVWLEKK
jgi:hypothetical protein